MRALSLDFFPSQTRGLVDQRGSPGRHALQKRQPRFLGRLDPSGRTFQFQRRTRLGGIEQIKILRRHEHTPRSGKFLESSDPSGQDEVEEVRTLPLRHAVQLGFAVNPPLDQSHFAADGLVTLMADRCEIHRFKFWEQGISAAQGRMMEAQQTLQYGAALLQFRQPRKVQRQIVVVPQEVGARLFAFKEGGHANLAGGIGRPVGRHVSAIGRIGDTHLPSSDGEAIPLSPKKSRPLQIAVSDRFSGGMCHPRERSIPPWRVDGEALLFSWLMKMRISRFRLITAAVFLSAGGSLVGFTQHAYLKREAVKRAQREASDLATADELRRRQDEPKLPFVVEEKTLREQGAEHWLLELKVRYRNNGSKPLLIDSPTVSVQTESGQAVPEFFLAFAPRQVVNANSEEEVELRYWLDAGQRSHPLWLEIAGDRLALDL